MTTITTSSPAETNHFDNCLDNFFKRFINTVHAETSHFPISQHEPEWPSLCQQGEAFLSEEMIDSIYWQPVLREENSDLSGLENALDIKLNPSIVLFFTRYWSDQIDTIFQQGNLTLLFVWNEADMKRLIENQIGHAFTKLRNKQTLTFFIACTDSDYIISVENDSGQVVLERPGYPVEKVLSPSLNQFINELEYGQLSL
ncbi:MAG: SecY-interacting protein [gamma proteobacterium symbiont of Bathyaustriella thionipta]|nr:SecY-interacting protein [gamma proteobacterium symbiont of Bathyaustriella thionipta]MCU7950164.1 SecY-interacting protein [gamma proteobacterium symbiont of Bathyaustriella thionipta]MCU7953760.1 SecY-interacting protein [gamma proteobacterium symbiont of Bathyaustriella thionipta]MCU7956778.1 SecY-interacting protein [gamma proteobacterium symbiont of Bathyaustriella thionipta]MCU7967489.1 SecY-interacting protein [gamma proteobacterium symbiont of Bathyaustriella thionipta]